MRSPSQLTGGGWTWGRVFLLHALQLVRWAGGNLQPLRISGHRKRGRPRDPPPQPPAPGVLPGVSKEDAPSPQAPPPPPQAPPPFTPGPYSIPRPAPALTSSLAKAAEIVQVLAGVCWGGWRWGAVLGKGMERNKDFFLLRDSLFSGRLVENIVRAPGSERKEGRELGRGNVTCR